MLSVLLESSNDLIAAGRKCRMPCTIQRDDYEVLNLNRGWRPAGAMDPAVQPVDMSIRSTDGRDLRCRANGMAPACIGRLNRFGSSIAVCQAT